MEPASQNRWWTRDDGTRVVLRPMEAKLLDYLSARPGQVVSAAELVERVWGYDSRSRTKTVYTTVARLRAAVERDPKAPVLLKTLPGGGFLWGDAPPIQSGAAEATELPRFADSLFGRADDLSQLDARALEGARLLTISGPPGVGKTRLAIALAERLGPRLIGRPEFVDLSACTEAALRSTLRRALRIEPGDQSALALALAARAGSIVILDGAEHVRDGLGRLLSLVFAEASSALFVVTSRAALRIRGERHHALAPFETTADSPDWSESAAFFLERAGIDAASAHRAEIEGLVKTLGGLPLALVLAAARARVVSIADLRELATTTPNPTLDGAISRSWNQLRATTRSALQRLCVFEGAVPVTMAIGIIGERAGDPSPYDAMDELNLHSLVLLHVDKTYLRILPPIRSFAMAQRQSDAEIGLAQTRLGEIIAKLPLAAPWARDARDRVALERVRAYLPSLVEARWNAGEQVQARALLARQVEIARVWGSVDLSEDLVATIANSAELPERGRLWVDIARLTFRHHGAKAIDHLIRAVEDAMACDDFDTATFALAWLRRWTAGVPGRRDWRPSVEPPAMSGREPELAAWLWSLSTMRAQQAPTREALRLALEALDELKAVAPTSEVRASMDFTLVSSFTAVGDLTRAEAIASATLDRIANDDPWGIWPPVASAAAEARTRLGQTRSAKLLLVEALRRAEQRGRADAIFAVLLPMVMVCAAEGDAAEARHYSQRLIDHGQRHHQAMWVAYALHDRGWLELHFGEPEPARAAFLEARRLADLRVNDASPFAISTFAGLYEVGLTTAHFDPDVPHPAELATHTAPGQGVDIAAQALWAWTLAAEGEPVASAERLAEARRMLGAEHGGPRWVLERATAAIERLRDSLRHDVRGSSARPPTRGE